MGPIREIIFSSETDRPIIHSVGGGGGGGGGGGVWGGGGGGGIESTNYFGGPRKFEKSPPTP